MVVVDVDDEQCTIEHDRIRSEPIRLRAVDRDENALLRVVRERAPKLVQLHEPVLPRQRRLAVEVHDDVLAELTQRERCREQRAESVTVGILMGRDEEAVVGAKRLGNRLQVSRRALGRAHR